MILKFGSLLLLSHLVFSRDNCPVVPQNVIKNTTSSGTKSTIASDSEQNPSAGNRFLLTFFENYPSYDPQLHSVFVTTADGSSVNFTVSVPGIGFSISNRAIPGNVTDIQVPISLTSMSATPVENRTVIVEAEKGKKIIVYGVNDKFKSTDAFLVFPTIDGLLNNITRYKYVVGSYTPSGDFLGFLAIIPHSKEGKTEVTINFHISGTSYEDTARNAVYFNKNVTFLSLNLSEIVYLCGQGDLTGTVIITDKPVSVFSGLRCSFVPQYLPYCDHLVEQIPPVSTWGTRFVTVPLKGRRAFDVFRFIAANNCTNVILSCMNSNGSRTTSRTFTLNDAQYHELSITSDEYCLVKSTDRLLVIQYSVGRDADGGHTGDPFMAILPPMGLLSANLTFAIFDSPVQHFTHYVNIIIPAEFFQPDDVYFSNITLSQIESDIVPILDGSKVAYYGVQVTVGAGSHTFRHANPYAHFSILVYGFAYGASYGYPAAYPTVSFDVDLYNLHVLDASDQCIRVSWDHPPDVTPGALVYKVLLRKVDSFDFKYEWSTSDTQATVCNLTPGTAYTLQLSSKTKDPTVNTRAGITMLTVRTHGSSTKSTNDAVTTPCEGVSVAYAIVPVSVLVPLITIITTVAVFLLTRCYYLKKGLHGTSGQFGQNTGNLYENGADSEEVYAEIQMRENPAYCPVEKKMDTLY